VRPVHTRRRIDLNGEVHGKERISSLEAQVHAKERELAEYAATNVVNLDDAKTARVLRDNLARFRELLRSQHTPKVRQVLRVLLGDEVLWFEPQEGGSYELTAETRLGLLFNSLGAQELSRGLLSIRARS
jgi:hypothetical protein